MTSTPTATAIDPTLRQGDSGAAVTKLQQLLNAKGINTTVDGIFGDGTRAAVVQFQKQNGIATDGIVGPQTWQALRRGGNAPIQLTDLRGVIISGIEADRIKWSRLYMEPVQASGGGLFKSLLPTIIAAALIGGFLPSEAIASSNPHTPGLSQESPVLMATAYTDNTLPTLRRGDRGRSVKLLQQILLDNGFLGAAAVRLGNPNGVALDGIFGSVTESAVRDLQQRYNVPVTGQMNPRTWEVLDMQENPYRSPLPWK